MYSVDKYREIREELKDLKVALKVLKLKGQPKLLRTLFEMDSVTVADALVDSLVMYNTTFDYYPFNYGVGATDDETVHCTSYRFRGYVQFQGFSDALKPKQYVRLIVFVRHRSNSEIPNPEHVLRLATDPSLQICAPYNLDYRDDVSILHDVCIRDEAGVGPKPAPIPSAVSHIPFELSGSCDLYLRFEKGAFKPINHSWLDTLAILALKSDDGHPAYLNFMAECRWFADRSYQ